MKVLNELQNCTFQPSLKKGRKIDVSHMSSRFEELHQNHKSKILKEELSQIQRSREDIYSFQPETNPTSDQYNYNTDYKDKDRFFKRLHSE